MRRVRLTMLIVSPVLVFTVAAAREAAFSDSSTPATATSALQGTQSNWTLSAIADRLVARQVNAPGLGLVPYDAVVLRRTLGGVTVDCGAFAKPSITDNAVSRVWTYVMTRPRTGICATVTGARFVAVGRKGSAETLSPDVP